MSICKGKGNKSINFIYNSPLKTCLRGPLKTAISDYPKMGKKCPAKNGVVRRGKEWISG